MPSKSAAQHRFMEAIAHSPSFARKAGVPQSVGKDFAKADDKAGITKTHHGRPIARADGGAVKETKAAAQYTVQGTKSEHCSICEHYAAPGGCTKVSGSIAAGGWCKLFARAVKRAAGGMIGRADGGDTLADTSTQGSGLFPTSGTQDPQSQQMIQRFSGMPLEGLQEAVIRMGPDSPMGRLAARVLQQKRAMPTSQSMGFGGGGGRGMPRPPTPSQQEDTLQPGLSALRQGVQGFGGDGQDQQQQGYAPGGMIKPPALGTGMMEPPWTRSAMRPASMPTSGFLHGATPGRADSIKTATLPNSFVIPADVVSGLGEGNSLAGAHALQMAMSTGPHGVPLPRGGGGRGLPRPPAAPHFTRGGKIDHVPVALSDGEFVINPEQVAAIGGGDIKRGFKVLEAFVVHARKKAIEKMKKLPGPVRS